MNNVSHLHSKSIKESFSAKMQQRMNDLGLETLDVFLKMHPEYTENINHNRMVGDNQKNRDLTRTVANWKNGKSLPDLHDFLLLCNALECDPNYLLTDNTCSTERIQHISDETGLSERTIHFLKEQKRIRKQNVIFNLFCEDECGISLFEALEKYIYSYEFDTIEQNLSELLEHASFLEAVGPLLSLSSDDFKKMYRSSLMNDIQYQLNKLSESEEKKENLELLCTGTYLNLCKFNKIPPSNAELQQVLNAASNKLK